MSKKHWLLVLGLVIADFVLGFLIISVWDVLEWSVWIRQLCIIGLFLLSVKFLRSLW